MHCYNISRRHWVGMRSGDCEGHTIWFSFADNFADSMCCSRDQQIHFSHFSNVENQTIDPNFLSKEILQILGLNSTNLHFKLWVTVLLVWFPQHSHWNASMRSDMFDCKFTSDGFSYIPSSSHPQSFTHLCIYQSILPLGPLMMIGPHRSPIDPPSLSPICPSGPLSSDAARL